MLVRPSGAQMDKLRAERRLRKIAGAFLLAGAIPGVILLVFAFPISILGAIPYLFIFRKWRGDEHHMASATGWLLAIAVNAVWLVGSVASASHGWMDIFVSLMSAGCLALSIVGMRAQWQYDEAVSNREDPLQV